MAVVAPEPGPRDPWVGRVFAFTDGVFAIAATLLIFTLNVPHGLHGERLHHAVTNLIDDSLNAAITFAVIGMFWLGHTRLWQQIKRVDQWLLGMNLVYVATIVALPLAVQILSSFDSQPSGPITYAVAITVTSLLQVAIAFHARRNGLIDPDDRAIHPGDWHRAATIGGVFALSVPIAFVSPWWAQWFWVLTVVFVPMAETVRNRSSSDAVAA